VGGARSLSSRRPPESAHPFPPELLPVPQGGSGVRVRRAGFVALPVIVSMKKGVLSTALML
jgi:hypothetical protein